MEDLDANDDTPEVAGEQGDVEDGGATGAEQDGYEGVEEAENESVSDQPAGDVAVPGGFAEGLAVEDGGLDTVDAGAEEADEGQELVHGGLGDEELLEDVAEAVESGAEQGEEITLDHVDTGAAVRLLQVIGADEDAHTAAADEDADDLEEAVADAQDQEGDDDDNYDGPEVDELGGHEVGVSVGKDGEVVALDVHEAHDQVLPAIIAGDAPPLSRAIADEKDGGVDEGEQDVVEDGLEGRDAGAGAGQQAGEGVGAGDAEGEDLADGDDKPEVGGDKVGPPVGGLGLEDLDASRGGFVVGAGVVAGDVGDGVVDDKISVGGVTVGRGRGEPVGGLVVELSVLGGGHGEGRECELTSV